jgi:hypothetical protein
LWRNILLSGASRHSLVLALADGPDLVDVDYGDNSGLGARVGLKVSAGVAYCCLELINFLPHLKELLHITKLSQLFGSQRNSAARPTLAREPVWLRFTCLSAAHGA